MADESQTPPADVQTPPLSAEGGAGQASEPVSPPPPKSEDAPGQVNEPVPAPVVEPTPPPSEPAPPPETPAPEPAPLPPPRPEDGTPLLRQEGRQTVAPFLTAELLTKARAKIQDTKRKKLDRIMTLFEKQKNGSTGSPQVTNDEVEKLLHVSDATATRYLDTLEKENRIKQTGKTGAAVFYEKI